MYVGMYVCAQIFAGWNFRRLPMFTIFTFLIFTDLSLILYLLLIYYNMYFLFLWMKVIKENSKRVVVLLTDPCSLTAILVIPQIVDLIFCMLILNFHAWFISSP